MNVFLVILFFIISNMTSASNTATLEESQKYKISITEGANHTCAFINDIVKCWGENKYGQLEIPKLSNPKQITAGNRHTCALDDSGVKCWGDNDSSELELPKMSNVKYISAENCHTCAIDDNSVKCWGCAHDIPVNVTNLLGPTKVWAGDSKDCALDLRGISCWGRLLQTNYIKSVAPPVKQLVGSTDYLCALDNRGVKCWGYWGLDNEVPELIEPVQISTGGNYNCALDKTGVKCWEGNKFSRLDKKRVLEVPSLLNPRFLLSGSNYRCAIDDTGAVCWGDKAKSKKISKVINEAIDMAVESPSLNRLELYLKKISQILYFAKTKFTLGLSELANQFSVSSDLPLSINFRKLQSRTLILFLLEPILELTKTDFVQSKVLPEYKRTLIKILNDLDIRSLEEIELYQGTFDIAISASALALKSAQLSLLSPATKKNAEEFLSQVGVIKAEFQGGYNKSQFSMLLNLIQQNKPFIEELTQNKDTEPFALVLLKIESFLTGK